MKAPDFGKMVGPLPLGVWVATVGGALGVAQVAKMRRGKDKPATVYDPGTIPFPMGMPLQEPPFSGATVGLPSSANPYPGPATYNTNTEWQRAAATELGARGYDPYQVQQALAKYLQGLDPLTVGEQGIVNAATKFVGFPPQPPSVAPAAPPPSVKPPPANRHEALKEGEFSGSGYYNSGTVVTQNGSYAYIRLPATAAAIRASGGTLYFQSSPGVFVPEPKTGFTAHGTYGTPLYQRIV